MRHIYLAISILAVCAATALGATTISDAPDVGALTGAERVPIGKGDKKAWSTTVQLIRRSDAIVAGGTCSTSYNINPANGSQVTLTLNGACQIGVTGLAAGDSIIVYLTQSASTGPTFASAFKWASGTAPTFSTTAGKYDTVSCVSPDGTKVICGAVIDAR